MVVVVVLRWVGKVVRCWLTVAGGRGGRVLGSASITVFGSIEYQRWINVVR